jgi:hypothetical protein
MNTAPVGQNDAILSRDTALGGTAKIVPVPVPRSAALAKAPPRKTAARVATPKSGAKLKRPASTVATQSVQATSQGGAGQPNPLGDLLRGLFGGP